MAARNERLGKTQKKIVDVVALLGAHFERIAETSCRQQAEPGATPLDDRVGDKRGAMENLSNIGERYAGFGREFSQALERRDRRVLRCRQTFIESNALPLGVVENKVGKRPSNIEADTMSWFGHDTTIRFARPQCSGD